ncbi:hypothetical protein ACEWY4_022720 [Coilia grayii]|uniref:Pyrin domain-containing protein n=1 Tax=Coilia grayii TaxID=363190 RepID=A0ABD1J0Z0_9TELE
MDALKNTLRTTLKKLSAGQFTHFKRHLNERGQIQWGDLENSDRYDTVDQIVQVYTIINSGRIVLGILRAMNLNQMALDMENELNNFHRLHGQEDVRNQEIDNNDNSRSTYMNECRSSFPFLKGLREQEKVRLAALREGRPWMSGNMKASLTSEMSVLSGQIRAVEEEIDQTKYLKERKKTELNMLKEQMNFYRRFKPTFDKSADLLESFETEEQIREEFEKLRQFVRDEEAAMVVAQREEEERRNRRMKEAFHSIIQQCPSLLSTR